MELVRLFNQVKIGVLTDFDELIKLLDQLTVLSGAASYDDKQAMRDYLLRLRQKLADDRFKIMVLGEFSTGKSTLINALLKDEILPTDIRPTTATINLIQYGDVPKVIVRYNQDRPEQEITIRQLYDFTSLVGPLNSELTQVKEIIIAYPLEYCRNGIEILDTPGLNSLNHQHEKATLEYLPNGHAAIMVLSATQFLSASEREYLRIFRRYMNKVLFVVTKIDLLPIEDSFAHNKDFWEAEMQAIIGQPVQLYPVNAKQAVAGDWDSTGMNSFVRDLERFLTSTDKVKEMLCPSLHTAVQMIDFIQDNIQFQQEACQLDTGCFADSLAWQRKKITDLCQIKNKVEAFLGQKRQKLLAGISNEVEELFNKKIVEIMQEIYRYEGDLQLIGKVLVPLVKEKFVEVAYATQLKIESEVTKIHLALQLYLTEELNTVGYANMDNIRPNIPVNTVNVNGASYKLKKSLLKINKPWYGSLTGLSSIVASPVKLFDSVRSFFKKSSISDEREHRQRQLVKICAQVSTMLNDESHIITGQTLLQAEHIVNGYGQEVNRFLSSWIDMLDQVVVVALNEREMQEYELEVRQKKYQLLSDSLETIKSSLVASESLLDKGVFVRDE